MTYNASERKDIRAAEKRQRVDEVARLEVIRALMADRPGRAFVHHKLVAAHVFSTSFSHNALQMAFNEGERNQGLQLLNDIMSATPDMYVLMMREQNERPEPTNGHASDRDTSAYDTFDVADYEDNRTLFNTA